jgi:hypothetical protein
VSGRGVDVSEEGKGLHVSGYLASINPLPTPKIDRKNKSLCRFKPVKTLPLQGFLAGAGGETYGEGY